MSRSRSRSASPKDSVSLYVKNINFRTEPDTLKALFEQHGPIKDVYMPRDFYTKKRKGFGYIEFLHRKDAEKAIEQLNDKEIDGMRILIEFAKGDRKSSSDMRRKE
jgi:RNA recognition motif-containing protein